ncbi:A/G-specific adenine glycosylase [Citricoccus sp. SGAir0253]|uniref:A/G-specific adenine glycosylase n=1 Tax=Citricoccus sp. SGAir0253 TaxID=2567881 RepID=UPI0010CD5887|nr:A/G-specific adenine glycosylase [Citricoccus sp. SGAir0253]QCU76863.1 A/G-specific adenine glycosylase [Citricoccus sp. SGAir0253]
MPDARSAPSPEGITATLHRRVNGWFAAHGRDLPWRDPACTPWGILVSEIMLQQTPVVRVLPVWTAWMERWPTPADLAREPAAEVIRAWGRLGYPRRALRLQAAAAAIAESPGGLVPADHGQLLALPGVGAYTAAAVACFAFGQPEVVVDTNIRRVHARLVSGRALPEKSLTAAEMALARDLMPADRDEACRWNAAVMELGALVCTARSPRCGECPVADLCAWRAAGMPEPHYRPTGQAWAGTDRQVRGAIMALLREEGPVPVAALPRRTQESGRLGSHRPEDAQLDRCVAGLLADGLAVRHDDGPEPTLSLPG